MEKQTFSKPFTAPDEVRPFQSHGHLDVLTFDDGAAVGRGVFEPGWRWSNDVKPIAKTASCQVEHTGYCLSGTMTVKMDNGEQFTIHPGDALHILPGHDAWTEGDESCVLIDVTGTPGYAKSR